MTDTPEFIRVLTTPRGIVGGIVLTLGVVVAIVAIITGPTGVGLIAFGALALALITAGIYLLTGVRV